MNVGDVVHARRRDGAYHRAEVLHVGEVVTRVRWQDTEREGAVFNFVILDDE